MVVGVLGARISFGLRGTGESETSDAGVSRGVLDPGRRGAGEGLTEGSAGEASRGVELRLGVGRCLLPLRGGGGVGGALATTGRLGADADAG